MEACFQLHLVLSMLKTMTIGYGFSRHCIASWKTMHPNFYNRKLLPSSRIAKKVFSKQLSVCSPIVHTDIVLNTLKKTFAKHSRIPNYAPYSGRQHVLLHKPISM